MPLPRLRQITEANAWLATVSAAVSGDSSAFDPKGFDTYWIEAGHHIRAQVADDRLLSAFLRRYLEPYRGSHMTLYRGENANRWLAGAVGFAWTSHIETARMFGRGLNAVDSGGVLLRCVVPASSIISGPTAHSAYLGESQFTVAPEELYAVEEIEEFPPWAQESRA